MGGSIKSPELDDIELTSTEDPEEVLWLSESEADSDSDSELKMASSCVSVSAMRCDR
jgi:hypothetical protein